MRVDGSRAVVLCLNTIHRLQSWPRGIPGLLVNKRITMQGRTVDYAKEYESAREEIQELVGMGQLTSVNDEVFGLDGS